MSYLLKNNKNVCLLQEDTTRKPKNFFENEEGPKQEKIIIVEIIFSLFWWCEHCNLRYVAPKNLLVTNEAKTIIDGELIFKPLYLMETQR